MTQGSDSMSSPDTGIVCTYCHRKNHTVDKCWKKQKDNPETRTCHGCGQKGHIRPDCPNKSSGPKSSAVNHVQPPDEARPSPIVPVDHGQDAKDNQLRSDLASMLERLQKQQHVQSVWAQPTWAQPAHSPSSSLFNYAPAASTIHMAPPGKSVPVSDVGVFVRNSDCAIVGRLEAMLQPLDYTHYHPDDFESRSAFYNWIMNCTCGVNAESCSDCSLCQGCCQCSVEVLPGTVAGGWGSRGDAHIGEASHPGPTATHSCCRPECPCSSSFNGASGEYCCDTCRFGKACSGE